MEISIQEQFIALAMSALIGIFLGAVYDAVKILRSLLGISNANKMTERLKKIRLPLIKNPNLKEKKANKTFQKVILFFTDILYFVVATLVMMVFIYYINFGIVRWYIFLGAILGMLLYHALLDGFVISVFETIMFFLRILVLYLVYFISKPFVSVLKRMKAYFLKLTERRKQMRAEAKKEPKKTSKRTQLIKTGKE